MFCQTRAEGLDMRLPKLLLAALAIVTVATAGAPGWGPYVVRSGDTLWGLAKAHHTSVAALRSANHLNGSTIYVGQTLEIPGLGAGKPAAAVPHKTAKVAATATYVVRSGDTLTSVAKAHHTTVAVLATLNHLSGRLVIDIGETLRLPAPPASVVVPKTATAASNAAAAKVAGAADPGHAAIRALVIAEARRDGLSPALAEAIATQESGFTMRIVSPTGAVGVMQLEPATAAWLSGLYGPIDPYNLNSNIRGGVLLLRLLESETSNQNQQIAAYYEGLGAVRTGHLYDGTAQYVASVEALERRYA
jgi:LysM repeat protein